MTGRVPPNSNPNGGGELAYCASNMAVTIHHIPPPIKRSTAGRCQAVILAKHYTARQMFWRLVSSTGPTARLCHCI